MTFLEAVRGALDEALRDPKVLMLGQLVKYGLGGLTKDLAQRHPGKLVTMPVAENFMHGSAMGLSLAGFRPVVVNERMDFLLLAMDPLINHAAIWRSRHRQIALPIVIVAVVGKGKGQGPQHSKNITGWFRSMEGLEVVEPSSPKEARDSLLQAIFGDGPVVYVLHREFFSSIGRVSLPQPSVVGLCGASARHERDFYEPAKE